MSHVFTHQAPSLASMTPLEETYFLMGSMAMLVGLGDAFQEVADMGIESVSVSRVLDTFCDKFDDLIPAINFQADLAGLPLLEEKI